MLAEKPALQILLGGVDEATDVSRELLTGIGYSDVTHGEGAAFFALDSSPVGAWAEIAGMRTVYKPKAATDVADQISDLLGSTRVRLEDIDLILLGACGNPKYDSLMRGVAASFSKPCLSFKNLCGEYSTASSFALWLAAMAIKKGFVPDRSGAHGVKSVLIYNHYFNQHHSVILLKAC